MIGAVIILIVLLAIPVAILMTGAGLAGVLGFFLGQNAEAEDEEGMYTDLNR